MLTQQQFVDEHRHLLCGLIADAATTKHTGGPLAVMIRDYFRKVDERLAAIYNQLNCRPDPVSVEETAKRDLEQRLRDAPKEVRALATHTNGRTK